MRGERGSRKQRIIREGIKKKGQEKMEKQKKK